MGHDFIKPINYTGYYFCENDTISPENLKLGSYLSARQHCKIKTPYICSNETLRDELNKIITQTEIRNPVFTWSQFDRAHIIMWTGATRHNETHFKDGVRFISSHLGLWLKSRTKMILFDLAITRLQLSDESETTSQKACP